MSSRVVEPEPCAWCGAEAGVRRVGVRWLCPDCRDDQREAATGPL